MNDGLKERDVRNKLRQIIMKAEEDKVMSRGEAGFVITLVERFRQDIDRKARQMSQLQGEISQLRANEKIIVDLIESIIKAAERDRARQETLARIKGIRSEDDEELNSDDVVKEGPINGEIED